MGKQQGTRPSQYFNIADLWLAYQFDAAVNLTGLVIENASQEMHKVGMGKEAKYEPLYRLDQLLSADFKLPRPKSVKELQQSAIQALKVFAGRSDAVKVFKPGG